ncbi:MAG TPA: hypothetical protein VKQ54_11110 [Caulobacteraceae bacterium]|nr:hypothetical protein [Caulobacteraceae bacterium]
MIGLAVVLGLAAGQAPPEAADLAVRMRDSAAAAQALQGPLDGTWTLWAGKRPLFVLQITDPAGGAGSPEGAWRRADASAPTGPIDGIARRGDRLTIRFTSGGEVVRVRLSRRADGTWSGEANENGRERAVALRRSAPDATSR